MTTIAITERRLFSVRNRRFAGRTAATIVRREYGRQAEIVWEGPRSATGRVVRYSEGAGTQELGEVTLVDGERGN